MFPSPSVSVSVNTMSYSVTFPVLIISTVYVMLSPTLNTPEGGDAVLVISTSGLASMFNIRASLFNVPSPSASLFSSLS